MASFVVDPKSVRAFESGAAFEAWLAKHHDVSREVFLRVYKKDAGVPTVTTAEALDVVLCWGWIDGIRKGLDEVSFLQRYTPRGPKSRWSQINCGHARRLTKAGRMTPHGQRQIDAAKADGRWDAAYASPSRIEVPPDLVAAIEAVPKAFAMFRTLNKANLNSLAYRMHHMKTADGRAKRIATFVAELSRGETPHPNGSSKKAERPAKKTAARASKRG